MQELHQNGQKIKLSVVIDAPEVVLPSSSHSHDIMVAYLGLLKLSNTFHAVKREQPTTPPPIYEDYNISVTDLTIYRYIQVYVIVMLISMVEVGKVYNTEAAGAIIQFLPLDILCLYDKWFIVHSCCECT